VSDARDVVLSDRLAVVHARAWWVSAVVAVGFAGALVAGAYVRIPLPFTPVPVTLQTLVVLVSGVVLGPRWATASMGMYLGLAAAGLPVTTTGALTGVTFGYLVGFVAAAAAVGVLARPASPLWRLVAAMAAGSAIIYLCGAGWIAGLEGVVCKGTMCKYVFPFLPGDAMKLAAAVGVVRAGLPLWQRLSGK